MKQNITLNSSELNELNIDKKLKVNLNNYTAENCEVVKSAKIGEMDIKSEQFPDYSIVTSSSVFYHNTKIIGSTDDSMFSLHFMLKGNSYYEIDGVKTKVRTGENNIWSINGDKTGYSYFKKGDQCTSMGIIFHQQFIDSIINSNKVLYKGYHQYLQGETFFLSKNHLLTTSEMYHVISQINNYKLMGNVSLLYLDAKIRELLSYQLLSMSKEGEEQSFIYCKTKSEIDKIREAKHILLSDIDNPPTIKELSLNIGMNQKKLKYGFKEVFNQTIYNCLFEHKMEIAKKYLLDTNLTILEVANKCGYDYASHFTTAFKKKFGVNPKTFKSI
jgi:AraC-like DNA-binding protein